MLKILIVPNYGMNVVYLIAIQKANLAQTKNPFMIISQWPIYKEAAP
jgi:hypothetical protein